MPVRLSYINARNEEVILDDDENSFAHELTGRTGFEMPEIETEVVTYGDGSQDIVLSRMKSRKVTVYFWVDLDTKVEFERKFREVKSQLMQVGSRMGNWGKLKVRQRDGSYLYLNCIYKSGFDSLVRDSNVRMKFSLSFEATDPLFYNGFETKYVIQAQADTGYLMMKELDEDTPVVDCFDVSPDTITAIEDEISQMEAEDPTNPIIEVDREMLTKITAKSNGLYMVEVPDKEHDNSEANPDSLYMYSAAMDSDNEIDIDGQKVYPTIEISGTAANIRIYNRLTDKKIEFDPSIVVDGSNSILIETKPLHKKVVSVNTATGAETNIMPMLTDDSDLDFYLERGINTIQFRNSESTPDTKCTFRYTEGFLSAD